MHPVSFSSVPKLSEDLLARIFAFYRQSQTAIKNQLNSLRIASVYGRVNAVEFSRKNWSGIGGKRRKLNRRGLKKKSASEASRG